MVLLEHTFAKLYNKLENHHNHNHHQNQTNHDHYNQPEKFLASLHAFRSEVSRFIGHLSLDVLKPGGGPSSSEILFLSLTWIEKCFGILPFTNKAFANLLVDIDYPLSTWEVGSIEGYLSYSLCLLEIFNSISSSLSHLAQSRLSLVHRLSVLEDSSLPSSMATKHLKPIEPCCSNFNVNFANELSKESDQGRIFSGKEWVVSEALKEMKSLGFWVCGILLSGLCSNNKPYMENTHRFLKYASPTQGGRPRNGGDSSRVQLTCGGHEMGGQPFSVCHPRNGKTRGGGHELVHFMCTAHELGA
ncbi:hypothetical protein Ahy_B03g067483 isoform B [Arachis hypogaea]|uniref:Uncharacterized protein n=1 Tax=Arachis hypogaea TaxID=3818 RepID=A0A445A6Y4_ARAHY|nr:hypothetical protein Ahy_B03g067483 isoform B [Arachis hypogaea]